MHGKAAAGTRAKLKNPWTGLKGGPQASLFRPRDRTDSGRFSMDKVYVRANEVLDGNPWDGRLTQDGGDASAGLLLAVFRSSGGNYLTFA